VIFWLVILVAPFAVMAIAATIFIAAEMESMRDATDDRFTLSEYWKWAKRVRWYWWWTLQVAGTALSAGLVALGAWLFGHWVLEVW
jgi:hypothetical protein